MQQNDAIIQSHVSLKAYNTFGLDVTARYFCNVQSVEALHTLLETIKYDPNYNALPLFILGGGSNVLFTRDFPGIVLHIAIKGIRIVDETDDAVWIDVSAGENWHQLVLWSLQQGYGGIENLSLIPGSVGSAPVQNIGAYGVELVNCFVQLDAIAIANGKPRTFDRSACEFGYRHSIFKTTLKNQYIITTVRLKLAKKPMINIEYAGLRQYLAAKHITTPNIHDVSDAVIAIRQQKLPDPVVLGNAGSFFKNPLITLVQFTQLQSGLADIPHFRVDNTTVKIPAAWLIEQCGWRGKRIDDIGVYQHQALVLVNYGNGSGSAIKQLASDIIDSVKSTFGITLQPEVQII